jgi:hypothetical protein
VPVARWYRTLEIGRQTALFVVDAIVGAVRIAAGFETEVFRTTRVLRCAAAGTGNGRGSRSGAPIESRSPSMPCRGRRRQRLSRSSARQWLSVTIR